MITVKEAIVVAFLQALSPAQPQIDKHEVMCLAEIIDTEARGESFIGKVGAGFVLRKRITEEPEYYGKSYCDVLRNKVKGVRTLPWISNPPYKKWDDKAKESYEDTVEVATHIILDLVTIDPTNGAKYFSNPKKDQGRFFRDGLRTGKLVITAKIDNHLFYQEVKK